MPGDRADVDSSNSRARAVEREKNLGTDDRFASGSDLYQSQLTQGGQAFIQHTEDLFIERMTQFLNIPHGTPDSEITAMYWRLRGILDCREDQQGQIQYATNLARNMLQKKGLAV